MSTASAAPTWRVPRESSEFVGPIAVTVQIDGVLVPADGVQFAVLLEGEHPDDGDWGDPATDPDDDASVGVSVAPVPGYGRWGIWATFADGGTYAPVLDPDDVGWIERV